MAGQLDVADPSVIKRYTERQPTAYEYSWEIRAAYGYQDFAGDGVHESLVEFMGARAWIHVEGAVALFKQAKAQLDEARDVLRMTHPYSWPDRAGLWRAGGGRGATVGSRIVMACW